MGQHKFNPTAIAAAKGELPPKPKNISKLEQNRQLYSLIRQRMYEKAPLTMAITDALTSLPYKYSSNRY